MRFSSEIEPFCEGRTLGTPEVYNTLSSAIMFFWSLYKLNEYSKYIKWSDFYCIYNVLSINCLFSSLFHGTLWMGFKLFDEFSMILPLWFGLNTLLKIFLREDRRKYCIITYFLAFINLSILVCDTFPSLQFMFPLIFTIEISQVIYLYNKLIEMGRKDVHNHGKKGIIICILCGFIWWICESVCTYYMSYGHALWHIGMPVGIDYILQYSFKIMKLLEREPVYANFIV